MRRVLAGNGDLVVRDAVAGTDPGRVQRGEAWTTRFGLNPEGEIHVHDAQGWHALFTSAGFRVRESEPCGDENMLYLLSPASALESNTRGPGSTQT